MLLLDCFFLSFLALLKGLLKFFFVFLNMFLETTNNSFFLTSQTKKQELDQSYSTEYVITYTQVYLPICYMHPCAMCFFIYL